MLGLAFRSNRPQTDGLVFIFHASLAIASFVAVVIFTTILIVKLKQTAKWRSKSTSNGEQSNSLALRDKKTMSMVALVACILIVCYTPTVVFSIVSTSVAEFSVVGRQSNIFHSAWSFAFLCHTINASINIFLYYNMSSKYRANFLKLFSVCRRSEERSNVKGDEVLKSTNTTDSGVSGDGENPRVETSWRL